MLSAPGCVKRLRNGEFIAIRELTIAFAVSVIHMYDYFALKSTRWPCVAALSVITSIGN